MDLTAARAELLLRGIPAGTSTTRLDLWINAGKNRLEDEYTWPWLETTTSPGAAPVTISDLKEILYVVDTTHRVPLTGLDAREVVDIDPVVTTTGIAEFWWLDGTTTLKTYPADTSSVLSVRYVKFSPELSTGTDTPLIPVRYHSAWMDFATAEAKRDTADQAGQQMYEQLAAAKVQQMLGVYCGRNLQDPGTIRVGFNSEDW